MTEIHRDVALVLLNRLRERGLITREQQRAACGARCFADKQFAPCESPKDQARVIVTLRLKEDTTCEYSEYP